MVRTGMIDIWTREYNELNAALTEINKQLRGDFSIKQYDLMEEGLTLLKKITRLRKKIGMAKIKETEKSVKEARWNHKQLEALEDTQKQLNELKEG